MQITLNSTAQTENNDPANPGYRVWTGTAADGTAVIAYVKQVSVAQHLADSAYTAFAADLLPITPGDIVTGLYARLYA
jgi:hypothetical protein